MNNYRAINTILPKSFIIYIICAIWLLCAACGSEEAVPMLPTKMRHDIMMESFNVNYLFSENGNLKAKLTTGHVQQRTEGDSTNPQAVHYFKRGVKIQFFNMQTHEQESLLTSSEGKLNKQAGLADLNGNVTAIGKEGAKLETAQLFWDEKQNKIYTTGYVKIQNANRVIEGEGFESNTELTRYRIFKARGQVQVNNIE